MFDTEAEYRKVFKLNKRWAKHWLTNTAHRAHSNTLSLIEPAEKSLAFIESINIQRMSYEDKITLLNEFYREKDNDEKRSGRMSSGYYANCMQYIKKAINSIEKESPVIIPKMPRS